MTSVFVRFKDGVDVQVAQARLSSITGDVTWEPVYQPAPVAPATQAYQITLQADAGTIAAQLDADDDVLRVWVPPARRSTLTKGVI